MEAIVLLLVIGVCFGVFGRWIADQKGISKRAGFWVGFFFCPLGILVLLFLPSKARVVERPSRRGRAESWMPEFEEPAEKVAKPLSAEEEEAGRWLRS